MLSSQGILDKYLKISLLTRKLYAIILSWKNISAKIYYFSFIDNNCTLSFFFFFCSIRWGWQDSGSRFCRHFKCHYRKSSRGQTDHVVLSNSNKVLYMNIQILNTVEPPGMNDHLLLAITAHKWSWLSKTRRFSQSKSYSWNLS